VAKKKKESLKLSDLREREFLGVVQVAGKLKISPGTISKLERNLETPRPALALRLAKFFKVDPRALCQANDWSWGPRPAKKPKPKTNPRPKPRPKVKNVPATVQA